MYLMNIFDVMSKLMQGNVRRLIRCAFKTCLFRTLSLREKTLNNELPTGYIFAFPLVKIMVKVAT